MARQRVILYVDGFNLYFGLRAAQWQRYYWLNLEKLGAQILRSDQELVKIKYFTARVISPAEKERRQNLYLEALATLKNTEIIYGKYLASPVKCFSCESVWQKYSEKMTDVNIAVNMIDDAIENRFDTALLLSADSDIAPAVDLIKKKNLNKRIGVLFPPKRSSITLEKVCDFSRRIFRGVLAKCQFPSEIIKDTGFEIVRPKHWS